MAKYAMNVAFLTVDGDDWSGEVSSIEVATEREQLDASVLDTAAMQYQKGRYTNSITLNLKPEADFGKFTELVQWYAADAAIAVVFRPKDAAKGAANPEISGSIHIMSLPTIGGAQGALFEGSITFPVQGSLTYSDGVITDVVM